MSFLIIILLYSLNTNSQVLPGIEVLKKNNFDILKDKKVGIIVNHTSVDLNGNNDVDLLIDNDINIKAIFSPEHGFFGNLEAGVHVDNSTYRGIPLYSLYGKTLRPTQQMLKDIDILVFDIQDIGTRFYTYLTTMGYAMEEAAKKKIEFLVLDRPNPVSSEIIEGAVLDKDIKAFTAYFNVPTRHSLTAGEMALFHKVYNKLDLDLKIIKMEGYKRDMFFYDTGIKWINPSPNIRNINAAILYSGIGCFEATNISVGRGTDIPFEFFGAPWLDNKNLVSELKKIKIDGVEFKECVKIPDSDLYAGSIVNGICIGVLDKKKVRSFDIFVHSIYLINLYHPDKLEIRENDIAKMTGDKNFYNLIKKGTKPQNILNKYKSQIKKFQKYINKNSIKLY